jgi:hypothetical protein
LRVGPGFAWDPGTSQIFAWQDGDFGDADVLVQNLNADGSLGSPAIFSDGFESGNLSAWSSSVP